MLTFSYLRPRMKLDRSDKAIYDLADDGWVKTLTVASNMNMMGQETITNVTLNHQLHTVSEYCGYHLENHHHALADAEACAWIAREIHLFSTYPQHIIIFNKKMKNYKMYMFDV